MFKRILKIIGICLAGFVVLIGVGVGIYALQGGFKEKDINILYLYMDDKNKANQEIYTLTDLVTRINFEPLDATNKELEVVVQDPLRIVENGELIKEGVLKNVPSKITAGEDFNIQINKDDKGNNIGGVVTLTFKPANNSKNITEFKLKVIVDVAIPNNALYFAGNNSDKYSTNTGKKNITLGLSSTEKDIYLKSNLVNAFCLEVDNNQKNLKNAVVSYKYINLKNELVEEKTLSNLKYVPYFNSATKEYNYYYKIPVVPRESGTIYLTAKMHRTYEIEKAYTEGNFDSIPDVVFTSDQSVLTLLENYNKFLNKYMQYFDTDDESWSEFFGNSSYYNAAGQIQLPNCKIANESKKFVFQTCEAEVNISAVNLSSIKSTDVPQEYQVFTNTTYSLDKMINIFGLDVTLDKENVAHIDDEKNDLFSTLQVTPYIYIEKQEYLETKDTLWQNYNFIRGVDRFENGKPVLSTGEVVVDDFGGIGFLVMLSTSNAYKDYITCNKLPDSDNLNWNLSFNVPLTISNTETSISQTKKALFMEFQVNGVTDGEKVYKQDYTRIYIGYTEYKYKNEDNAKLSFHENLKRMSINQNLQNAKDYNYADSIMQDIDINLSDSLENYSEVQYKNVMFFAEQTSNRAGNSSKLATIGTYNFRYMKAGATGTSDLIKLFDNETQELIGERLLNRGSISEPDYYMHAINACNEDEPVRIFAIVYLSDVNGNPIDVNGRPIKINETVDGEPTTLVVFAITDITESGIAKVNIDNFVDNFNYYTVSAVDKQIIDDSQSDNTIYSVSQGNYVKRNKIDSYVAENGIAFSETKLEELQEWLKLKLLESNRFTLLASNYELDANTGKPISTDEATQEPRLLDVKDFYGNVIKDKLYNINTFQNKQIALEKLCENFDRYYYLNITTTNTSSVTSKIKRDDDGSIIGIEFEIFATGKNGTKNDLIYVTANDGVVNALDGCNDFVEWEVNKLEINDVVLPNIEAYKKLYSKYSDPNTNQDSRNPKTQTFGTLTLDKISDTFSFENFLLYTINGGSASEGSIEDNVDFQILTNLYDVNSNSLNEDLIDMSQLRYNDGDIAEDKSLGIFKDIESYIKFCTENSNSLKISYLNPSSAVQLKGDLIFSSQDDNYIHVANTTFPIKQGSVNIDGQNYNYYIEVGGKKFGLVLCEDGQFKGQKTLTIKANEYFPIVRAYKSSNNKQIVMILGQEFTIETESNKTVIYNITTRNAYLRATEVSTSVKLNDGSIDYSPKNYIYDGTLDNSNKDSSLDKNKDDTGKVVSATVHFVKGGTLKENGKEIFVVDENGRYYKKDDGTYDICPSGYEGTRYNKKGITTFVMITYRFNDLNDANKYTYITKVLTYELVQEPITLIASERAITNTESGQQTQNKLILKDQTEVQTQRFYVNAGQQIEFRLGAVKTINDIPTNTYSINVLNASFEDNFFKHCTIALNNTSSKIKLLYGNQEGTQFKINDLNTTLKLVVPDSYIENDSITMLISYRDENNQTVTKQLEITIQNNYEFKIKDKDNVTGEDEYVIKYNIEYNADGSEKAFDVKDYLSNYFDFTNDIELELQVDSSVNNAVNVIKVENNQILFGKSYALVRNGEIVLDDASFKMYLIKSDGTRLEISKSLRIVITNPKYTLDLSRISGSVSVLNGSTLFSPDYITIYNGYSKEDKVASIDYLDILKEILDIKYSNNSILKNGYILYSDNGKPITENKVLSDCQLTINKGFDSSVNESTFNLTVVAYELYFDYQAGLGIGATTRSDTYPSASEIDAYKQKYAYDMRNVEITQLDNQISTDYYFAIFTKGNTKINNKNVDLYAVLYTITKDENNVIVYKDFHDNFAFDSGYYLAIATMSNGRYNVIMRTNINVKFTKVSMFADESGKFDNNTNYSSINNKLYAIRNVTLKTTADNIDITNYLRAYAGSTEIKVVLLVVSTQNGKTTETVVADSTTKNLTIEDNVTYVVAYQNTTDSKAPIIKTNYTFSIEKVTE